MMCKLTSSKLDSNIRLIAPALPKPGDFIEVKGFGKAHILLLTHDDRDNYITIAWETLEAERTYRFSVEPI